MPLILLAIAAGLVMYAAQVKEFSTSYKVKFQNLHFDFQSSLSDGFRNLYFVGKIKISNPTEFKGKLVSGRLFFIDRGKGIGKVDFASAVEVRPQSTAVVSVPVSIQTKNIFDSIRFAIDAISREENIKLKVIGTLQFEAGNLSVNEDLVIKLVK